MGNTKGRYEEILEWMYTRIPMYQRQGKAAYKSDLATTEALDACMGHPHRSFRSVHVGGTNGKGSVSHILASVLQKAGYKTGLYTSPHLKDFRERIRVNGRMVEKEYVVSFIERHHEDIDRLKPSFFEMTVAMAFEYFRHASVDVAVLEVGMGGRLDSTNIVDPDLSVITNISLDHTQFLGNTREKIAAEKAGIIKAGRPVLVGETDPQTAPVFRQKADEKRSRLYFADHNRQIVRRNKIKADNTCYDVLSGGQALYQHLCTDLMGSYQSKNILTAIRTFEILRELGYNLNEQHLRKGISQVAFATGFMGRWMILQHNPVIIFDTAHNQAGLDENIRELKNIARGQLHFVLSFVNDKQLDDILGLFPASANYYFTKATIPRALDEKRLARWAANYGLKGRTYPEGRAALESARQNADPGDLIYVGGSTFLISDLM